MNNLIGCICFIMGTSIVSGQVLMHEDFEAGVMPDGWAIETQASDGGWLFGSPAALSSPYFGIAENGSSGIACTNDDGCNCNKSLDRLILPVFDFTNVNAAVLQFDVYFLDNSYAGFQERAYVEVSTDSTYWQAIEQLHGHGSWDRHFIDLSGFAYQPRVYVAFRYTDNGGWTFGMAVDNVTVEIPYDLDANLVYVNGLKYGEEGWPFHINGIVTNNGATNITSLEVSYALNGQPAASEVFDSLDVTPFENFHFSFSQAWLPDASGLYDVQVDVRSVNGMTDGDVSNNSNAFTTEIFEQITPPDKIRELMDATPVYIQIAGFQDMLDKPTDLDFFPILGKDEVWVINQRDENSGGSTLTISDATKSPSNFWHRVDGNAWHFMSLPTAIAFSDDNFNFANSPGVKDANHSGGTFTGPALWSSDPEVYAQPSGGNGSHLDMLHGSPFSMGICHEVDNVFWVYDDWNTDIVRYDFAEDHGPGNADHSDAIVYRYKGLGIDAELDIPNHLILDKETGWLYVVDNGNDRVIRIDINSGTSTVDLPLINEELAVHAEVKGYVAEVVINQGIMQPCGIEIFRNYLLVGEYSNGDVLVYDMDNNFEYQGKIETGFIGLTGIKIGPDGNLWYTNRIFNTLIKAEPGETTSTPVSRKNEFLVSPNPAEDFIHIRQLKKTDQSFVQFYNAEGALIKSVSQVDPNGQIDVSDLLPAMYMMIVQNDETRTIRKIVIQR